MSYNVSLIYIFTVHCSCPLWVNSNNQSITIKSICEDDGTWGEPKTFPNTQDIPPTGLKRPDEPDIPCRECQPLRLTYNPNLQPKTEIFCEPPVNFSQLPVKIESDAVCHLLCDKIPAETLQCGNDGNWKGNPESGLWCMDQNAPLDFWQQ